MAKATPKRKISGRQIVFMVLMFSLLFNYPILSIFNKSVFYGDIPLLFIYLFVVWFVMIVLLFYLAKIPKGRLK